MKFQWNYLKILKDDVVKLLHSMLQQIWKTHQRHQYWKMSVFISIPNKGNSKEYSNYHTIVLISHPSKVMFKNPSSWTSEVHELRTLDVKLDLEKAEEPEIKLSTSVELSRKQRNSEKTSISTSLATLLLLLSRFSHIRLCATPYMAAHQAPLSLGLFRQEHWSGLPLPSAMHAC